MRDPIVYAIPLFLLLMAIEFLILKKTNKGSYRLNDTVSNLACGIGNRLVLIVVSAYILSAYEWIYQRFAIMQWTEDSVVTWVAAFILGDFAYYWWHRASHRVNFMWAVHVVHHQSEDYNLGVALRQAWLSPITYLPFFIPLAVLGLPTVPVFVGSALNLVYQFWIHTEVIDRMSWFEKVMNTPSHHRVHHGINRRYLDKNYAGVFITWDRVFKTFELETEKVVYGIVSPLKNWSPIWANIDHWNKMFHEAKLVDGNQNKLKVFFKGPEWTPSGARLPEHGIPLQAKYETTISRPWFAKLKLFILLAITFSFMWNAHLMSIELKSVAAVLILLFSAI